MTLPCKAATVLKTFVVCPGCGEGDFCVSHLFPGPREFGPWHCPQCRLPFTGRVNSPGDIDLLPLKRGEVWARSLALLRLQGADGPIYFVMDHDRYIPADDHDRDPDESERYYYEEHSCPTNWLRDCCEIVTDGAPDPHGLLEYVRFVDVPNDFDADNFRAISDLFPEVLIEKRLDAPRA